MKFISVRDFRSKSGEVWKNLAKDSDYIVTNHGKPAALLTRLDENNYEDTITAIRQARLLRSISAMQSQSKEKGLDKLGMDEIDALIKASRRERGSAA
jgi:PHD/YefM family antitoxin component YafN of YafNO toxin-antitoxin module